MEKQEIGHEAKLINEAFDQAGLQFKADRPTVLAAFKNGEERSVTIGDDGKVYSKYDGQVLPLSEALHRFGHDRRDLVDGRTLPREDEGKGRPGGLSKASFATVQEKVSFIREHGSDAYERLPLKSRLTSEVKFREDFFELPRAEKVKRLAADPGIIRKAPQPTKGQFRCCTAAHRSG